MYVRGVMWLLYSRGLSYDYLIRVRHTPPNRGYSVVAFEIDFSTSQHQSHDSCHAMIIIF